MNFDLMHRYFPQLGPLLCLLESRWEVHKDNPEGGFENLATAVVITALAVVATIAVVGIVVTKIRDKANSIDLG